MNRETVRTPQFFGVNSESGFSLMEILMVLAIIAVLIAGAVALLGAASETTNIQAEQQTINGICSGVTNLFNNSSDYTGLDNSLVESANIFPVGVVRGGQAKNKWGGDITVAPGASTDEFTITYTEVPEDACLQLGVFNHKTWESVTINGDAIDQADDNPVPLVSAACDETNTIVYTSR